MFRGVAEAARCGESLTWQVEIFDQLQRVGDVAGNFKPIPTHNSGFFADGDVRNMVLLNREEGQNPIVVVANNDAPVQVFKVGEKIKPGKLAAK